MSRNVGVNGNVLFWRKGADEKAEGIEMIAGARAWAIILKSCWRKGAGEEARGFLVAQERGRRCRGVGSKAVVGELCCGAALSIARAGEDLEEAMSGWARCSRHVEGTRWMSRDVEGTHRFLTDRPKKWRR